MDALYIPLLSAVILLTCWRPEPFCLSWYEISLPPQSDAS